MTFRDVLTWKTYFYGLLLPVLRVLGPAAGDAILGGLGRFVAFTWPQRRRELDASLRRLGTDLGDSPARTALRKRLEGNVLRYLARDCLLDGTSDADFFARFDVRGVEHLDAAFAQDRGVILVGSHLGQHLRPRTGSSVAARPLRLLLQRAQHISQFLRDRYDVETGPHPQAGFFLRRHMAPHEAAKRIMLTRAALRDGLIVYLKGDVPWTGANTRPARLFGHERTFQSLWAEFAALFEAPVVPVFCTHLPRGRYALTFDPAFTVSRGDEGEAVVRYIARLEAEIHAHPADAVGHLLWPCYGPPVEADPEPGPHPTPKKQAAVA